MPKNIEDPSNTDDKFKRVRVRNFLKELQEEGLDRNKFLLTIKNLKFANQTNTILVFSKTRHFRH